MKKIVTVAVLSAFIAVPAVADDAAAMKAPAQKPELAKSLTHRHGHKKVDMNDGCELEQEMAARHGHGMMQDDCETEHGMAVHRGQGMMGGTDMMPEPDMHLLDALNLGAEQHAKINKLIDELRHNNWNMQGSINDESAKLRDLYQADKRDPAAIGKEYQKVFDLKRQMIEAYLDTQNRIEEILTDEQRARVKDARHHMRSAYRHGMH